MTTQAEIDWREEFGIKQKRSAHFFGGKDDLRGAGGGVPQAHVIRRAFDLLKLDGVLCSENAPLVYFKHVERIEAKEAVRLHRDFWNHGGAPIFVLFDQWDVHVYSGLRRPTEHADSNGHAAGFVGDLKRASSALLEFLPSVESGEFFRRHAKSFDPLQRVDRDLLDNLEATREKLIDALARDVKPDVLDALLCRLVFTCYLFDRDVIDDKYLDGIGIPNAAHLRDVLAIKPRYIAKDCLYNKLFKSLGVDFNGDLFSDDDLQAESDAIAATHLDLLENFFKATDVQHGQQSFWPYNFGVIPIETISAIYERFLKPVDRGRGAFYTPRFLVEVVLDLALLHTEKLIGKTYLDPACGSGIFLVGVFNRIAEEWNQANPDAENDRRANELLKLLQGSVFGVDVNPTACRITAFSLYLAYLDQLSPRGIREIQKKKGALPRLVSTNGINGKKSGKNIFRGDFFADGGRYPQGVDLVVGNPPWGSIATQGTPSAEWCAAQEPAVEIPNKQIAAAFMCKAPRHLGNGGSVCFVLPHGTIFNHSQSAIDFQSKFFEDHEVDRVLNLADYQNFLFAEARHPAVVMQYKRQPPTSPEHSFEYWAPKCDWLVRRAEVIAVAPEDRSRLRVRDVLDDLQGEDAPQIWKRRMWATPRDWRLIERLSGYPRLRDRVRQAREVAPNKPWFMAVGFQPLGQNDPPESKRTVTLPGKRFIPATSKKLSLFLLENDCKTLLSNMVETRRSINDVSIFRAPHVLVAEGFSSTAFAAFDVSFQHALRGINGPESDRELLIFLAAYLRSSLARYFLFHTSSNWGVSRSKVHVEELLRLPFPVPDAQSNPKGCWKIVRDVAAIVLAAANQADRPICDRRDIVSVASRQIEPLLDRYFDVVPEERPLIRDTLKITIPSLRPSQKRRIVPTIMQSDEKRRDSYTKRLCETLDGWARETGFAVTGNHAASSEMGVGVTVLHRSLRSERAPSPQAPDDLLKTLGRLQKVVGRKANAFELVRGVKAFDEDHLYVVKPLSQRFWTETAALNDADEIAGSILMHSPAGVA